MNAISVRFCVGCGYLCDEIHPEGRQPLWIDGHTYVMKYGVRWSDLDRRDDACPNCARVFAIAQRGTHPDFPERQQPCEERLDLTGSFSLRRVIQMRIACDR
jgi:hypothetical protein